jgi:hypothetical protein
VPKANDKGLSTTKQPGFDLGAHGVALA